MLLKALKRYLPLKVKEVLRHAANRNSKEKIVHEQEHVALLGMTSLDEQSYYTSCVSALSDLDGAIVDLGCGMCSTAISLARGVTGSASSTKTPATRIYAIDRFIWEEWMLTSLSGPVHRDYLSGESFLPEARRRVRDESQLIELVEADLSEYVWRHGPIKILLVDSMKSWILAKSIPANFYAFLVEGGILIHQDFKHFYTPWIHLIQYRLRDFLHFKHEVENGATVAFEISHKLRPEVIASATQFENFPDEEVEEALKYSMGLVGDQGKSAVAAAHIMYFIHKGRLKEAQEVFFKYSRSDLAPSADMSIAHSYIKGEYKI